ncbi:MAG: hypothetical protein KAR24_00145 [Candidatus Pacebacteria bacterium]|nr:hypothetical protein [Candidatus Paceibacterota bacterium]
MKNNSSKKCVLIAVIIVLGIIAILFYLFNPPTKNYFLNSGNTHSVVSDEYHKTGTVDAWVYHFGEWTPNKAETYGSLIKFNILELENEKTAMLHLNIQAFDNKTIKGQRCSESKKFNVKKILSSWDYKTVGYSGIENLQNNGEVIANFTVDPDDSFVEVELPVSELAANGFTISQADGVLCRVSFYSHSDDNNSEKHPYFIVNN